MGLSDIVKAAHPKFPRLSASRCAGPSRCPRQDISPNISELFRCLHHLCGLSRCWKLSSFYLSNVFYNAYWGDLYCIYVFFLSLLFFFPFSSFYCGYQRLWTDCSFFCFQILAFGIRLWSTSRFSGQRHQLKHCRWRFGGIWDEKNIVLNKCLSVSQKLICWPSRLALFCEGVSSFHCCPRTRPQYKHSAHFHRELCVSFLAWWIHRVSVWKGEGIIWVQQGCRGTTKFGSHLPWVPRRFGVNIPISYCADCIRIWAALQSSYEILKMGKY